MKIEIYKCDICGAGMEPLSQSRIKMTIRTENQVYLGEYIETEYDLCHNCAKQIINYITEKGATKNEQQ